MQIKVLRAGPMATIQDRGRFGYMEFGIGQCGVMDVDSYNLANELVGNHGGEAVIEATLLGPSLYFEEDTLIAFAGADMQPQLDGRELERGIAHRIPARSSVNFGMAKNGVRAYIAVAGGFDVPVAMGSRSTDIKCEIGGLGGKKLADGDLIKVSDVSYSEDYIDKLLKKSFKPAVYEKEITIRVIEGPQAEYFTEAGKNTFYSSSFSVSPESDRMGIRLNGDTIEAVEKTDIVSDGIAFGSIQVTSSGQPIVLMADHQTTGGYAKIATVYSKDLPLLAQAVPGTRVRFSRVELKEVQKHRFIQELRELL